MFRSVFRKDVRDQRRGLVGWSIGIVVTVASMAAVWPTMRDMGDLEAFLANYPEPLRKLFDIDAMTTGAGFLNTELFSIMLPAMFIIFAVGRGARLIAGEEEAGTLDILASTPMPRARLYVEKAAALIVAIVALGIVTFASTAIAAGLTDMGIATTELVAGSAAMTLLGVEFGLISFGIGAFVGRRSVAVGAGAGLAAAGYLLYIIGALVESVEPWRALSPFHQALEGGPLGGGWVAGFAWLAISGLLVGAAALPRFQRRDLAV